MGGAFQMKKIAILMVIAATFFTQSIYCQSIPRLARQPKNVWFGKPVYHSWAEYCYWQRVYQTERDWYETMDYPTNRNWRLLNQLSR